MTAVHLRVLAAVAALSAGATAVVIAILVLNRAV